MSCTCCRNCSVCVIPTLSSFSNVVCCRSALHTSQGCWQCTGMRLHKIQSRETTLDMGIFYPFSLGLLLEERICPKIFGPLRISPYLYCLFVLRFYGPFNTLGSCRAWSVYLATLLLGSEVISSRLTSIVLHIFLQETDNCLSWISRRERMTVENISWSTSTEDCFQPGRGQTRNLLNTSRKRIQLSHWGRPTHL